MKERYLFSQKEIKNKFTTITTTKTKSTIYLQLEETKEKKETSGGYEQNKTKQNKTKQNKKTDSTDRKRLGVQSHPSVFSRFIFKSL